MGFGNEVAAFQPDSKGVVPLEKSEAACKSSWLRVEQIIVAGPEGMELLRCKHGTVRAMLGIDLARAKIDLAKPASRKVESCWCLLALLHQQATYHLWQSDSSPI